MTLNYDDAGNRSSVVNGGTVNYAANNLNQYNSVGSVYYDYDLNGNTTYDGVAFYTYDAENRLTGATNADGTTAGPFNPAVDNMDLTFTTGGDANWAPVWTEYYDANEGPDSAAAGVIGANDETWFQTTVIGEGTISYYIKKNAGTNDSFAFKVDDSSKWWINNSSLSWTKKTHTITGAGSHTLKWRYSKGGSGTTADGGVWVDKVEWNSTSGNSTSLQRALDAGWTAAIICSLVASCKLNDIVPFRYSHSRFWRTQDKVIPGQSHAFYYST